MTKQWQARMTAKATKRRGSDAEPKACQGALFLRCQWKSLWCMRMLARTQTDLFLRPKPAMYVYQVEHISLWQCMPFASPVKRRLADACHCIMAVCVGVVIETVCVWNPM